MTVRRLVLMIVVGILIVMPVASSGTGESASGGDGAATAPGPLGKYDPPIRVTAFKVTNDQMTYEPGEDINDNIWMRLYKEELGIDLDIVWTVPEQQAETKVNVQIAANDLPDISTVSTGQFKTLTDSGLVQGLNAVWDEYASPLTREAFEVEDRGLALSQVSLDGELYGIPRTRDNLGGLPLIYIRQDWLDALGLPIPRTIDDLERTAEAFATMDPDGNGADDTLGISFSGKLNDVIGGMNGFFMGFGAYPYLAGSDEAWVEGSSGDLVAGAVQPEVRVALERLADWYDRGVLDNEFATRDVVKIAELASTGKLGLVYAEHWFQWMWPMPMAVINQPDAEWITIEFPTVTGDPGVAVLAGSLDGAAWVAHEDFENPEAMVKMLNLYQKVLSQKSEDYDEDYHVITKEDGSKVITWHYALINSGVEANSYGVERIAAWYENRNTDYWETETPWVADMIEQIRKYLGEIEGNDNMWNWTTWLWGKPDGAFSINRRVFDEERYFINGYLSIDTPTMSERSSSLRSLRDEVFTKIIMNVEPIDAFDEYVADWYRLGGEDILSEINAQ
jgi:putative aldouronate transport system substrate-binding protein